MMEERVFCYTEKNWWRREWKVIGERQKGTTLMTWRVKRTSCGKENEGKMWKNGRWKKKDVQWERWIIVTQTVQTAVIWTQPKVIFTVWSYYHRSTLSRGQQHVLPSLQRRWLKHAAGENMSKRKSEGLCEVEVKQVGSSFAADWSLCLQEICRNLPLPASQGSCEGINQDFIQAGPDTSTMSQTSKNKNYSWGNKVSPETSYFSMETIYVIFQE